MSKKQCLWPADGSSSCVVIPKILSVLKQGGKVVAMTMEGATPDEDGFPGIWIGYPTELECDAAYDSLIQAIRTWWEE